MQYCNALLLKVTFPNTDQYSAGYYLKKKIYISLIKLKIKYQYIQIKYNTLTLKRVLIISNWLYWYPLFFMYYLKIFLLFNDIILTF